MILNLITSYLFPFYTLGWRKGINGGGGRKLNPNNSPGELMHTSIPKGHKDCPGPQFHKRSTPNVTAGNIHIDLTNPTHENTTTHLCRRELTCYFALGLNCYTTLRFT